MIGEPVPNPRDAIIQDLNQKMEQFFGSGKTSRKQPRLSALTSPFIDTRNQWSSSVPSATSLHLSYGAYGTTHQRYLSLHLFHVYRVATSHVSHELVAALEPQLD